MSKQKVKCNKCDAKILPTTAKKNNGLCAPCSKKEIGYKKFEKFMHEHPALTHMVYYLTAFILFFVVFIDVNLWGVFFGKDTPEPSYFLLKLTAVYITTLYLLHFLVRFPLIRAIMGFMIALAVSVATVTYYVDDKSFGLLLVPDMSMKIIMGIGIIFSFIGAWVGYSSFDDEVK